MAIAFARTAQRTAETPGSGFMASHASVVRDLAATIDKRFLDDAEHAKLVTILCHYSRQLAAHRRPTLGGGEAAVRRAVDCATQLAHVRHGRGR